jgi:LuxR family maltose regulon positive regulatory protein
LKQIEATFAEGRWKASQKSVLGEVATIRAMVAFELGDLSRSKALAELALNLLPETNKMVRSVATLAQGMAQLWDEDERRLQEQFANAAEMAHATGNLTVSLFALGFRTMLAVRQGHLQQAAERFRQTVTLGTIEDGILYGPAGFACVQMGEVLREWNRLEEAEAMLLEGAKLCQQQTGMPIWVVEGHVNLARLKLATGDEREAEKMMQKAEALMAALPEQGETGRRFLTAAYAYRLRYWLARGKTDAAHGWLARHGIAIDSAISSGDEMFHLLLARVLIAEDALETAEKLLRRVAQAGTAEKSLRLAVEIAILQALWRQAHGEQVHATAMLSRALQLAEPEGYVRLFLDYGEPMARLLGTVAAHSSATVYTRTILAAMGEQTTANAKILEQAVLPEPLDEQELQILRLMAAGCTNREIADELYLSVNTIKVYASRLYAKLGVHRRGEAVARTQELGLL